MMPVDYPCNLPAPLVSQNTISPQTVVRMQQVAGGPPIAKLFSSDTWVAHNCAFSFNELQYQVFVQWYIWTTKNGSLSINIPLKNSLGLTTQEAYIPSYQSQQLGKRWTVTCQIIVVRQEKMDECYAESLVNSFSRFESLTFAIPSLDDAARSLPNGDI